LHQNLIQDVAKRIDARESGRVGRLIPLLARDHVGRHCPQ